MDVTSSSRRAIFRSLKQSVVAIATSDAPLPATLDFAQSETLHPYSDYPFQVIGSGFIVDAGGIILTARHVIERHLFALREAKKAGKTEPRAPLVLINEACSTQGGRIINDMFLAPVRVIESSDLLDLAALGIRQPRNRKPVTLLPLNIGLNQCEEGDEIATCGFPLGSALLGAHPSPYFYPSFS